MSLTTSDFGKICRVCLKQQDNLTSILNSEILNMFHTCTKIKIKNNELPKNICPFCLDKLNAAYIFNRLCEHSDYILRQIIECGDKSWFRAKNSEENQLKNESNDLHESKEMIFEENDILNNSDENNTNDTQTEWKIDTRNEWKIDTLLRSKLEMNDCSKSPYRCETCYEEFLHLDKLVEHTQAHHEVKPVTCTVCNTVFTLPLELSIHMQSHEQVTCHDCGKAFTHMHQLKRHSQVHSDDRPHICTKCYKTFKDTWCLKMHEKRVHLNQVNRQKCDICQREVFDLKVHKEVHLTGDNFQCEKCSKYFGTEAKLKRHTIYTHDKIYKKTFLCNVCGVETTNGNDLRIHMRIHTGEKPFTCDTCDKSFRFIDNLTKHKTTHTHERPFVCEICSKSFKLNEKLKSHMITHTDQRPHICTICSKSFNAKCILKRHMRVHSLCEK